MLERFIYLFRDFSSVIPLDVIVGILSLMDDSVPFNGYLGYYNLFDKVSFVL